MKINSYELLKRLQDITDAVCKPDSVCMNDSEDDGTYIAINGKSNDGRKFCLNLFIKADGTDE